MSVHERVAASFVSRYFELLMTDAKQLASFYLPKAQFNHEGKTTSITGSEGIAKALARLYPVQNHGRVVIKEMKVQVTEQSAGRFAVTVGGTFYRRGATEGDEFRHVIELQEHQGSNGVYGICADTKKTIGRPVMSEWARETPPMFAKAGNEAAIPELVQPPATEPPACIPEPSAPAAPSAKVETPKTSPTPPRSSPKLDAAAAPAAEDEVPAVSPVQEETTSTITPSGGDVPRAERKSFADLVRAGAQKAAPASNPTRVEAKLADEGKGAKEDTDKPSAAAESGKKTAAAAAAKPSGATSALPAAASKPRKDGDTHDGAAKVADKAAKPAVAATAAAAATGGADAPRRKDGPKISPNVIFYDVIVKGLPQDATEKSVHAMISPMAPVKKINVKSQPDKKDASITRTFAFVLFDHDSVVASGSTVAQTIQRVIKESRVKFGSQRIQVDEVREKFTQEDPRERDTA